MPRTGREQTVDTVATALASEAEIRTAVVYGSVLEDRFSEHSDVDLAVSGDHELSYDELLRLSDKLGQRVGREVQVRDLRRLQGLILREVLTQGAVLKNEDPDLLGDRIVDMLDFTEDWLPMLRVIQEAQIQRIANDQ